MIRPAPPVAVWERVDSLELVVDYRHLDDGIQVRRVSRSAKFKRLSISRSNVGLP